MFFENLAQLDNIIKNAQTIILRLFDGAPVGDDYFHVEDFAKSIQALVIEPDDGKLKIEQVRSVIDVCTTKQLCDRFFIFTHAETMTPAAANSLLKLLEEPLENYHFILITTTPKAILPTIRSRAATYAPKIENALERPPVAEKEVLELAKRLLVAKSSDIPGIIDIFAKKKDDVRRNFTLKTLETAIELAEKSYFKTKNAIFATKIQNLIAAHNGVRQNGNLKLQLMANLI